MNLWKKPMALCLSAALSLSVLGGCGSTGGSSDGTVGAARNGTEKTAGSDTPKTHKLKLLGQQGNNQFLKFAEREEYPVWQEVQKLLDGAGLQLDYELVANEQYKVVVLTRMAAGTNLPDIVNISPLDDATALTLAKQGILKEIGSLIGQYSDGTIRSTIEKYYANSDGLTTAPDGKKYWFTNLHYKHYNKTETAPVGPTMLLRKDWMDRLGLAVPTTKEEFFDVVKAFRDSDANGSGKADEVLVLDPKVFNNGIAQWFGLGVDLVSVDATSLKVVTPWYQDGIKEYFKYMQSLIKAGVLDSTGLANPGETLTQKRAENKLSADYSYGIQTWDEGMTPVKDAAYMPIMPLKPVDGITPYSVMEPNTLYWDKYAITKDCKDLEGAIRFFDVVHSDRYIELLSWGIKDSTYYVDENGTKFFKNIVSDEEAAKERRARGNRLYGGTVFPIIQEANLEYELASVPDFKKDYQLQIMKYTPWYSNSNSSYMAMPDDQQLETLSKILNNLTTYSQELSTKLILGQSSLEDWDSYLSKFKQLGLDELLSVSQARVDKYQELLKK